MLFWNKLIFLLILNCFSNCERIKFGLCQLMDRRGLQEKIWEASLKKNGVVFYMSNDSGK